ncbi:MAG: hypothetical protein Fur0021_17320 [Candidatus Promineifilaceae bacterium]
MPQLLLHTIGLWSVSAGIWSVNAGIWSVNAGIWSVSAGIWSVSAGIWSVNMCNDRLAYFPGVRRPSGLIDQG